MVLYEMVYYRSGDGEDMSISVVSILRDYESADD